MTNPKKTTPPATPPAMAPTGVDLLRGVEDCGVEGCAREGGVALLSVTSGRPGAKGRQSTERDELRKVVIAVKKDKLLFAIACA